MSLYLLCIVFLMGIYAYNETHPWRSDSEKAFDEETRRHLRAWNRELKRQQNPPFTRGQWIALAIFITVMSLAISAEVFNL